MQEKIKLLTEKKTKRPPIDKSLRQSYVDKWKQSSLSMSAYCQQEQLPLSSFSKWLHTKVKRASIFKPVSVLPTVIPATPSNAIVEILMGQDIKIRFLNVIDTGLIVALLKDFKKCN
jgi:hypothetical protein